MRSSFTCSLSWLHEELWARNGVTGTDDRWAHVAEASWKSLGIGHGGTSCCWDGHEYRAGAQIAGLGTSCLNVAKVRNEWEFGWKMFLWKTGSGTWYCTFLPPSYPLLMKSCVSCCFFHLTSWGITCPSEPRQRDAPPLPWDPPHQPSTAQAQLLA